MSFISNFYNNVLNQISTQPFTSIALPWLPYVSALEKSFTYTSEAVAQNSGAGMNTNSISFGSEIQNTASSIAFGSTTALIAAGALAYFILNKRGI